MMLYGNKVNVMYRDPNREADMFTGQEFFVNISSGVLTIDMKADGKLVNVGVPLDLVSSFGVASDEVEKEEMKDAEVQ